MSAFHPLQSAPQLDDLIVRSQQRPQVIFKHSTRCVISSMALSRFDKKPFPESADYYLLDLIQFRSLSNDIATRFSVAHQSPQVLLIVKGECVYTESHLGIEPADITEKLSALGF